MDVAHTLHLWDTYTGQFVWTYQNERRGATTEGVRANALAWSPDGSCLALSRSDGTIELLTYNS